MKLTGENRSTRGENLYQCHFVHHKSHMDLTWDRTRASAMRGRRLTAWAMALPFRVLTHNIVHSDVKNVLVWCLKTMPYSVTWTFGLWGISLRVRRYGSLMAVTYLRHARCLYPSLHVTCCSLWVDSRNVSSFRTTVPALMWATVYAQQQQSRESSADKKHYLVYHRATSRRVAGSIPDGVIGIFHWNNPSGCTMALGSTQPLTEISTRNISWG
jgi:hypothetical protein